MVSLVPFMPEPFHIPVLTSCLFCGVAPEVQKGPDEHLGTMENRDPNRRHNNCKLVTRVMLSENINSFQ